eukprot:2642052-Alexandrium_andersonii.AAC.1
MRCAHWHSTMQHGSGLALAALRSVAPGPARARSSARAVLAVMHPRGSASAHGAPSPAAPAYACGS